jgi:hypothetical protein
MATRDPYEFTNHAAIPSPIRDRMVHLLKSWDDANHNYDFVSDFTSNGILRFGASAQGHDAIKAMKAGMIHPEKGPIVKCQHVFEKGFMMPAAEQGKQEFIGTAEVTYELANGRKVTARPASHACFVREGEEGEWLAEYYEVHMDSHELMEAIRVMNEQGSK